MDRHGMAAPGKGAAPGATLRLRAKPEDFVVREVLKRPPGKNGDHAVYRVTKRLLTTLEVQQRLAQDLGVAPRSLSFPALKDRGAQATQYFSVKGRAPDYLRGQGYVAQFEGRYPRPLGPQDLAGNWFTLTIRRLDAVSAGGLVQALKEMELAGCPNYFDDQRFGSYGRDGVFIGKLVVEGRAEEALKAYFTISVPGDPAELRPFKRLAAERWGDWAGLIAAAPRSNHRSILTFLKDHPEDHRRALNLVTPRLLPLLLQAYQSALWNRVASRVLDSAVGGPHHTVDVAGMPLAVHRGVPPEDIKGLTLALPSHRAEYPNGPARAAFEEVLAEEGLEREQLKARIMTRAYLPKGTRPLLVFPTGTEEQQLQTPEGMVVVLTFLLPPGAYATLVVKVVGLRGASTRFPAVPSNQLSS
jgi:tRNA pseudouridine13 synthase